MGRLIMKTRTNYQMGTFLAAVLAGSLAIPALAGSKNKLDAEVRDLTDYFEKVQKDPANAVPAEILSKAEGLIVMRNYKAGFIIGAKFGLRFMPSSWWIGMECSRGHAG
jgi:lipid-binding SYLF domain-containing protein